eukprot:TRINITY_DN6271_c0_g1_i2.p1 TRINITY_DN6271_c0_g1~~TRINITY_DN6271_c0_g1_i2.p1  ORF type:complete len:287 (+),score=92.69 TRINITY_DN6271_c0_g1_i2:100-861(+)
MPSVAENDIAVLCHQQEVTERVVHHLTHEVWCRVGASQVHGVGLFALRDIPTGTNVDHVPRQLDPRRKQRVQDLVFPRSALDRVPPAVAQMVKEMWVGEESWQQWSEPVMRMTGYGANAYMGIGHFVNHPPAGTKANAKFVSVVPRSAAPTTEDIGLHWKMVTTRPIAAGEEVFVDYGKYIDTKQQKQMPGIHNAVVAGKDGELAQRAKHLWENLRSAEPNRAEAIEQCRQLLAQLQEPEKERKPARKRRRKQ